MSESNMRYQHRSVLELHLAIKIIIYFAKYINITKIRNYLVIINNANY